MPNFPTKLVLLSLFALTASCGESDETDHDISAVRAAPVTCLAGEDLDADGLIDRFSIENPRFFSTRSVAACRNAGGTPFESWPRPTSVHALRAAASARAAPADVPYNAGGTPPIGLRQDVINTGIHNRTYEDIVYDCDDFANDLEDALEDLGYHATYTEICIPGTPSSWHALTDVHLDGETYWFDAITGQPTNLDHGGNGTVQTSTTGSPCARATEGGFGVRVWENLEARLIELGPPD